MTGTEWFWLSAILGAILGFFGVEWTRKHWRSPAEKRAYRLWLAQIDDIAREHGMKPFAKDADARRKKK